MLKLKSLGKITLCGLICLTGSVGALSMSQGSPGQAPAPTASPTPRDFLGTGLISRTDPRLIAGHVAPVRPNARYLLHVSRAGGGDPAWAQATCVWLHNIILLERKKPVETDCVSSDVDATSAGARITEAKAARQHQYGFYFVEQRDQSITLKIENWLKMDDTDFTATSWLIEAVRGIQIRDTALQARLRSFFQFDGNRRLVSEYLLAQGSKFSRSIVLGTDGQYTDRVTGRPLAFEDALAIYRNESARQKNFLRAAVEIMAMVGLGAIGYWKSPSIQDPESNDYWGSMRTRFTSMNLVRFDDNDHRINQLGHPLSGYFYYNAARTNGFNSLESLAMSFAASTVWEYIVEGLEVVSINDLIVTPMAGFVIGEVFHQLRSEFTRRGPGRVNRVLRAIFGGPEAMDTWVRKHAIRGNDLAGTGFNPDVLSRVQVFTEFSTTSGPGGRQQDVEIGADIEIMNIPAHNRPGTQSIMLRDTPYSHMLFKTSAGSAGFNDIVWFLQAAIAGYYKKNITEDSQGRLRGYSFLVGGGSGFHYEELYSNHAKDQLGIVNILGPMIDATLFYKGATIHIKMDAYADFTTIRGIAVDEYVAGGGTMVGTKEVLKLRDYYYAFGMSTSSSVEVRRGRLDLGASGQFRYYDSIEGADLRQSDITNDFNLIDRRGSYRIWAGYTFPRDRMKLELGVSGRSWSGMAGSASQSIRTTTVFSRLRVFF